MELQRVLANLDRTGVALFAISYDSVNTLAAFARRHAIDYPLLSDEGSGAMRRLGMVDDELDRHAAEFGRTIRDDQRGVAYPGVFLLDRDGTVAQKRFHPNYRIRDTGSGLLEAFVDAGSAPGRAAPAAGDEVVRVRASLDSPVYRPYQQLQLAIEIAIDDGWHVYATPVPDGYTPLALEIAPFDGLTVGAPTWPHPRRFRVRGVDEEFHVLDGTVRVRVPVTLAIAAGSGPQRLDVTVRYQACSETGCAPPAAVRFELALAIAPFPD